jgi:hypothetical protein
MKGALGLLEGLEHQYVRAVRLFDVIGDVLLHQGKIKAGIRYKTLHEILKGAFQIAEQEKGILDEGLARVGAGPVPEPEEKPTPQITQPPTAAQPVPRVRMQRPEPDLDMSLLEPVFPVTAEMAHEFMRQGHYDRALSIFNTLMEKRPADQELRAAMEKARRKSREKTVLAVLQGWLENIQRMRRELATGS